MNWKNEALERLRKYDLMCTAVVNIPQEIRQLEEEATAVRASRTDKINVLSGNGRREEMLLDNMMRRQELYWKLEQTENWVQCMNRAMDTLAPEERQVLQGLYILPVKGGVERLCRELGLESSSIYRKRDAALRKFTTALYGAAEN